MKDLEERIRDVLPGMEGWCSPEKGMAMARLVVETGAEVSVEIGVFGGRSLVAMAMAHEFVGRGRAHGIDPWAASEAVENVKEAENVDWWSKVDYEAIHAGCLGKVLDLGLAEFCSIYRTTSARAAALFDRVDILHIDGNHSEAQSMLDVETWLPKVPAGGHVWFDDTDWPSTAKAQAWLGERCDRIAEVGACALFRRR